MIPVLSVIAVVTILFGNITAVAQGKPEATDGAFGDCSCCRIPVARSGGFWAELLGRRLAVLFYLFTYLLGLCRLWCDDFVAGSDDGDQKISHYENFAKEQPFLGGVLAVGLGSLAGIPPLGGFIGKLFLCCRL